MKEQIDLKKNIYESNGAISNLDREFNEFKTKNYTIKEFFKVYNQLFYDIPKKAVMPAKMETYIRKTIVDERGNITRYKASGPNGENTTDGYYITDTQSIPNKDFWITNLKTHKEIVEKSGNYAGVGEDSSISQISDLQLLIEKINTQIENLPKKHPIFENGTILESPNGDKHYIVEGKTRKINNSNVWKAIRTSAGLSKDDSNTSLVIKISQEGLEAIGEDIKGPIYQVEDLY